MAHQVSTGLHTAHEAVDVVHQKLRKTVSDISSSLRHSSSQELPRRATMDEIHPPHRRGVGGPTVAAAADESKRHHTLASSSPAAAATSLEESPRCRLAPEDLIHRRNISASEDLLKKPTPEDASKKLLDERMNLKDRQRHQTTVGSTLSKAQALYKSDSKSSLSETELKVEVRTSAGISRTDHGGALGTAGISGSSARKVSPLLGHRSSVSQKSGGLASGTDSSLDSDQSYEFSHSPNLPPGVPASSISTTLSPSIRGRSSEMSLGGGVVGGTSRPISVSRDPSLDNVNSSVTSSDSSSQELDSAHVTEDSHSSEAADESEAAHHARALAYSSGGGCGGGSSGGESGYVSPYLSTERGGLVTLGPSLLLTRATIAQYDTKRTITTVVAPKSSFDENRVRIQVPAAAAVAAAAAGGSGGNSRGITTTSSSAGGFGADVSVSRAGQQHQGASSASEGGAEGLERASPSYVLRTGEQELPPSPRTRLQAEPRSPVVPTHVTSPEHPRKPSPNRNPRFV